MSSVDFATKLDMITDYYGVGTIWDRMGVDGLTTDQINAMFNSLPSSSFNVSRSFDGTVLGREYTNPFELPVVPGTDFDSNIPGGSFGGGNSFTGNVPANIVTDPSTGDITRITGGATTGGGLTLPSVVDKVGLAVMGVNIGAKLGLAIDSALYRTLDDWFGVKVPGLDPTTWNRLCGQSAAGDWLLRTLFGITNNDMTAYIPEELLAYYYQLMRDEQFLNVPGESFPEYEDSAVGKVITDLGVTGNNFLADWLNTMTPPYTYAPGVGDIVNNFLSTYDTGNKIVRIEGRYFWRTYTPEGYSMSLYISDSPYSIGSTVSTPISCHYLQFYCRWVVSAGVVTSMTVTSARVVSSYLNPFMGQRQDSDTWFASNINVTESSDKPDGVSELPDAVQYPPTNITGTTPQQVLPQLKQQYPDLFDGSVTQKTLQDDGTVTETTLVPIPWTTTDTDLDDEQATTGDGKGQTDTQVDPETGEKILPTTPQDEQTQPPDTGEGSTPTPPMPTGSASSLWAVYNPSQGELNSFGAWLWSSNFVEQIKKLFADPMQAIIGVHKVFASPHTGGSQTIKCGYLDSGVSASVVTNQYTTVDCGSASLREYFGNVFDYDPFTKVSIFLPFIGIVPLNTADVMRSTISVKYRVDVITGACLAEVSVSRDGGGGILYTYGGSAIVTYPVSSGSYVGAVQAALSTALGIGSAIATGGASLGASAGMVLGGLANAKTQVQHSGQFSGSSGAMGGKKPYLIVSRPQTRTPKKISDYKGIPSNAIHKLSSCSGFVKVQEVHVASKSAYDNEIQEIESLLKAGVII